MSFKCVKVKLLRSGEKRKLIMKEILEVLLRKLQLTYLLQKNKAREKCASTVLSNLETSTEWHYMCCDPLFQLHFFLLFDFRLPPSSARLCFCTSVRVFFYTHFLHAIHFKKFNLNYMSKSKIPIQCQYSTVFCNQ